MTDHALAAPVEWAITPRQLSHAGSVESRGTGSQLHSSTPVRASNARTSPLAAFVRLLSATDEPVTIRPLITAGGDVSSYSSALDGALRRPWRRFTVPAS